MKQKNKNPSAPCLWAPCMGCTKVPLWTWPACVRTLCQKKSLQILQPLQLNHLGSSKGTLPALVAALCSHMLLMSWALTWSQWRWFCVGPPFVAQNSASTSKHQPTPEAPGWKGGPTPLHPANPPTAPEDLPQSLGPGNVSSSGDVRLTGFPQTSVWRSGLHHVPFQHCHHQSRPNTMEASSSKTVSISFAWWWYPVTSYRHTKPTQRIPNRLLQEIRRPLTTNLKFHFNWM